MSLILSPLLPVFFFYSSLSAGSHAARPGLQLPWLQRPLDRLPSVGGGMGTPMGHPRVRVVCLLHIFVLFRIPPAAASLFYTGKDDVRVACDMVVARAECHEARRSA